MQKKVQQPILWVIYVLNLLVLVFAFAIGAVYSTYTGIVVKQQEAQLSSMADAAARNLEQYFEGRLRSLSVMINNPAFRQAFMEYQSTGEVFQLRQYMFSLQSFYEVAVSRVCLVDPDGEVILEYEKYRSSTLGKEDVEEFKRLASRGFVGIGPVFHTAEGHYEVPVISCLYIYDEFVGSVVEFVDVPHLCNEALIQSRSEGAGYISLKDENGLILLDKDKSQIGLNVFEILGTQEDVYPKDYRELLESEYQTERGNGMYDVGRTHKWQRTGRRIEAYTRMNVADHFWVVSATIYYKDALAFNSSLTEILLLCIGLIVALFAGLVMILFMQRNRRRLESDAAHLREINNALSDLNKSREQLRHYQKLQTLGTFASGIAHEFNNLLTPIIGYTEMLEQRLSDDTDAVEDLEEIRLAGERAQEIIQQILPFSRKNYGPDAFTDVNAGELLQDVAKMVQIMLPSSIEFIVATDPAPVKICGSRTQLHQALLNLCSNAYQSMKDTGGTLTIASLVHLNNDSLAEVQDSEMEGSFIQIVVEDTGCGISPQILEQIFDPFFTTKDVGSGTGLGLSIVQSIVHAHNGTIHVTSTQGEGSRFTMNIPCIDAASSKAETKSRLTKQEITGELSVLLVDDERAIVRMLEKKLRSLGYSVQAFEDPEQAYRVFSSNPQGFDLVITDYTMPVTRGTTLSRAAKRLRPELPIILMTGLAEVELEGLIAEGIVDYAIRKPVSGKALQELLSKIAGKRKCNL